MAPKNYGVNELREMFLAFFETKGHSGRKERNYG